MDPVPASEMSVQTTMQRVGLTVGMIFEHGRTVYADSQVATARDDGTGFHRASFAEVARRAERLASGLARLGSGPGTGSGPCRGTGRSTSRPTSPFRGWGRCSTPSTSASFPSN